MRARELSIMRTKKLSSGAAALTISACIALVGNAPALASNSRHYWSPCVSPADIYGPRVRYGVGIPWLYVPTEPMAKCGPPTWLHNAPKRVNHSRR